MTAAEPAAHDRTFESLMTSLPAPNRRYLALCALSLAAATTVVAAPGLFGERIAEAVGGVAEASPAWMWVGAAGFAAAICAFGCAWRAGLRACGADLDAPDAAARYAAGSLANAFVPAGAGGAVRIALFARTLPSCEDDAVRPSDVNGVASAGIRLWTAGGVAAAVAAAKAIVLAVLVAAAAIEGFPLWPVLVLAAIGAAAAALVFATRRHALRGRAEHALDAFRALGRSPDAAARILGWMSVAMGARVVAAAAVAAAVGVDSPVRAALVAVPALALASVIQLTPGNVGVASGAVAVALHLQGVDVATALTVGIAFHALETAVSIVVGAGGLLYLTRAPRWSLRVATAASCVALVGGFGATVLLPLV